MSIKQKVERSPAKKWLRRIGITLAGLLALPPLLFYGFSLAFRLRRPPTTIRLVRTIDLPGASVVGFADYLTLNDSTLYAGYTTQSSLVAIDTRTDRVIATVGGLPRVHGFAADPATGLGFTSDGGDDAVGVIDLKANRVLGRIPAGGEPDAVISDPPAHVIYAANHNGKSATLVDPGARIRVATIPLGGVAEFAAADPRTGYVYQNIEDTNETVVVDPKARKVIARYKTVPGDGPTGLALDPGNRRVFVVCGNSTLVVLNEDDGHVTASLNIGAGVDGVGYDPGLKRVYTANASGTMSVIQQDSPDRYHVLENAPTPLGGHALAVDSKTHRIYLVCAGLGPAKIAVFEPTP